MSGNITQREYAAYRYINELSLVRYYTELKNEIRNVFDILNSINPYDCTLDEIFWFIERIDAACRSVLSKAKKYKSSYNNLFESNRDRFCTYANQIVDNAKRLCASLDNFYEFVETMFWRRNRERYQHKKMEYDKQLQNIIKYMNHFSANLLTTYDQDCDWFEL
tara:strand:- start:668 stop:1159 length:492 start_codon:yes stop_codon:yes gene_type:complete